MRLHGIVSERCLRWCARRLTEVDSIACAAEGGRSNRDMVHTVAVEGGWTKDIETKQRTRANGGTGAETEEIPPARAVRVVCLSQGERTLL